MSGGDAVEDLLRYSPDLSEPPELGPGEFAHSDWHAMMHRLGAGRSVETTKRRCQVFVERGWLARARRYDPRSRRPCWGYRLAGDAPDDFRALVEGEVLVGGPEDRRGGA